MAQVCHLEHTIDPAQKAPEAPHGLLLEWRPLAAASCPLPADQQGRRVEGEHDQDLINLSNRGAAFQLQDLQGLLFAGELFPQQCLVFVFLHWMGNINLDQELFPSDPNHFGWDILLPFYHILSWAWQAYF